MMQPEMLTAQLSSDAHHIVTRGKCCGRIRHNRMTLVTILHQIQPALRYNTVLTPCDLPKLQRLVLEEYQKRVGFVPKMTEK